MDGTAIIWCEGAFMTPEGKTAHGLLRFTDRYRVIGLIDRRYAGRDAGEVLDGVPRDVPVFAELQDALARLRPSHFVVGIAPDGGKLREQDRTAIEDALTSGLHVDCGLHDFLSDDPELRALAERSGARIRDVRKPPPVGELHHFTGRIEEVTAHKVAVLGTDSAVGKRTTAVLLAAAIRASGVTCEMIGTGQTSWMQGHPYSIVLDSLINDFVAGELEHAVLRAWDDKRPDVIIVEGQGSLMNPAYPGGFEILAATRPDVIVLQHAPARQDYDGFPGYAIQPLETQLEALTLISRRPVVAVTLNHEGLDERETRAHAEDIERRFGLSVCDPVRDGITPSLLNAILRRTAT